MEDVTESIGLGQSRRKIEEAEARYRAVLEQAPADVTALAGLAELAQRRGDMNEALDWYERAFAADSGKISLQLQIAGMLRSLGRLDEAEAKFRCVVEQSPGCASALTNLAEIATLRGDLHAALTLYRRADASEPGRVAVQIGTANTLRKLGRFDEADERYRAVLEQRPDHAGALEGLGYTSRSRTNLTAALAHFESAAASQPRRLSAQLGMADVLQELGRFDEADARYRAVLEQRPDHAAALEGLGETARRRADFTAALAHFQSAVASQPRRLSAQLGMADVLRELGRFDEADTRYRAVLEQRPDHVAALEGLGDTARNRGDLTAALAHFKSAAASQPQRVSVQLKIGGVLRSLAHYEAAEECYRALLAQTPEQVGALIGLGETARLRGDLNAALNFFQAAAANEPGNMRLIIRVADAFRELLRLDEADKVYRAILQVFPRDLNALVGLGLVERKRKNDEAALTYFETAAAEAPGDPRVWHLVAGALRGLCRFEEAGEILAKIEHLAGVDDLELQVRQFEHFCVTLQLAKAEKFLLAWGSHRNVPRSAVILTAQLYAALGQWSNVLTFFRERVVESEWVGPYDQMVEPLVRAARATGLYTEVCGLLDRLPNASTNCAGPLARDQLVEEMRLRRLLDPSWPEPNKTLDTTIADPFRAGRAELLARVLHGPPSDRSATQIFTCTNTACLPNRAATQIFTCTDGAYLIGASVSIFSLLRHNDKSMRDCCFTVFCADNVLELGAIVFDRIGASFATHIDVRPSSSLFSNTIGLRTGWGIFTPGHALSQAAYYRIYAARQLIDEGATGRGLYIDADTCVFSGLERLLAFELAGQPLGVRLDDKTNPAIRRAATLLGLEPDRYFNSGVLAFDLRHPELRPALDNAIEISLTEQHRLTFVDQCVLNLAFCDRFVIIPEHFNVLIKPDTAVESLPSEPTIIHFITRPKPWDPMYATPNCMPWLTELAAMNDVIRPNLTRRLLALQYPPIHDATRRAVKVAVDS